MKRFKLVKEYPFSPPLGTIAEDFGEGYRILDEDETIISFINGKDFMNAWGEYWKEIPVEKEEKKYTIEDIEKCVEHWGLCKVEREYIEKFLEDENR